MKTAMLTRNPKRGITLDTSEAVLFVCYAACRLHPGFSTVSVPSFGQPTASDGHWDRWLCEAVGSAAATRGSLPEHIADTISDAYHADIELTREEILALAREARDELDAEALNEALDTDRSAQLLTPLLACSIMGQLVRKACNPATSMPQALRTLLRSLDQHQNTITCDDHPDQNKRNPVGPNAVPD